MLGPFLKSILCHYLEPEERITLTNTLKFNSLMHLTSTFIKHFNITPPAAAAKPSRPATAKLSLVTQDSNAEESAKVTQRATESEGNDTGDDDKDTEVTANGNGGARERRRRQRETGRTQGTAEATQVTVREGNETTRHGTDHKGHGRSSAARATGARRYEDETTTTQTLTRPDQRNLDGCGEPSRPGECRTHGVGDAESAHFFLHPGRGGAALARRDET
ncbi:hypothetical protein WMY93_022634 [Mugilogobius chulae]|uniref:Uncharacterized protein n=1 Tax=Mugilogobius chulae TaxID=88201 RepID=A0AAW0NC17_9GOBI